MLSQLNFLLLITHFPYIINIIFRNFSSSQCSKNFVNNLVYEPWLWSEMLNECLFRCKCFTVWTILTILLLTFWTIFYCLMYANFLHTLLLNIFVISYICKKFLTYIITYYFLNCYTVFSFKILTAILYSITDLWLTT